MSAPPKRPEFEPSASLTMLSQRSLLLQNVRGFFLSRGFLEVETPLLDDQVIPELHIDPIRISSAGSYCWLQASPELHMKRLMASGAEAIFQITRSFRASERGQLHNPEFTLVEWYRRGDGLAEGMNLLDELLQAILRTQPAIRTTYAQAFERTVGLCPHGSTLEELNAAAYHRGAPLADPLPIADRDELLNLLLAKFVEPELGQDRPEIIFHYPASQSSLARVIRSENGYEVAERFEAYYRGVELANGFHELRDANEQRRRFEEVNRARIANGREGLPMPERLLAALEFGLPDCTGCALGFDRLVMLAAEATSIDEVIAFPQR